MGVRERASTPERGSNEAQWPRRVPERAQVAGLNAQRERAQVERNVRAVNARKMQTESRSERRLRTQVACINRNRCAQGKRRFEGYGLRIDAVGQAGHIDCITVVAKWLATGMTFLTIRGMTVICRSSMMMVMPVQVHVRS